MMRIITGRARGIRLDTLEGEMTRPTTERAKEAIFSRLQFEVEGRRVLDLFAGSGQMGLEALSRGATHAVMVDQSKEAIAIIRKNAERTRLADDCTIVCSDFSDFLRGRRGREPFDLVFIDPPYSLMCAAEAVRLLQKGGMLALGAIVVCEVGEENFDPECLPGFEVLKSTHYGKKTFVNILLYRGEDENEQ